MAKEDDMSGETKQQLSNLTAENASLKRAVAQDSTLRDKFAMAALSESINVHGCLSGDAVAEYAYIIADAMLKARDNEQA